ncbi:MAG: DUF1173 domain-containing protein [Rhodocyclaceae bacterium]|nr:MAG: DUF1173 domain-containing protein [Rhodocyclaceae bacterium]
MKVQRFVIRGHMLGADDPKLQEVLAQIYDTPERPRCLCVADGVEMYVARHRRFVIKRMPDSGSAHHPSCPSYEPEARQSGLGELMGDAVLESVPGQIELRVAFPWTRIAGHGVSHGEPKQAAEVVVPRRRMTLRAVLHFLFERAGFNRWSPAMAGKRNQGVLCKYLMEAAEEIMIKGVPLAQRLYVPELFKESAKGEVAGRRREKLAVLRPRDGQTPLALVIGEYKGSEATAHGRRIWIRHMPDAPLLIAARSWERIERVFAPLFESWDADIGHPVRLVMVALIRARREYTYEIEAASLMLTSGHWIPIEGVHELPLIDALVSQHRPFVKPLRYDARSVASFPNVLLLDAGPTPVPLHVVSPFMETKERAEKERAIAACKEDAWVWWTDQPMPPLKGSAGLP